MYATGHDHNLQIIEAAQSGCMWFDVLAGGCARLPALVMDATGGVAEAYARWLR